MVAPNWDSSGSSAAVAGVTVGLELVPERHSLAGLGARGCLGRERHTSPDMPVGHSRVRLAGTGRRAVRGQPGANTGRAILHRGPWELPSRRTMRGGLRWLLGVQRLADGQGAHWATSAMVAGRLFDWLTSEQRHVALNCNVPNVPRQQLRGIRVGRLAAVGTSQTTLSERAGRSLPLRSGPASTTSTPWLTG